MELARLIGEVGYAGAARLQPPVARYNVRWLRSCMPRP